MGGCWKLVKALYSPVVELILRVRGTAYCKVASLLWGYKFLSRGIIDTL
jgi:hypothetical protein